MKNFYKNINIFKFKLSQKDNKKNFEFFNWYNTFVEQFESKTSSSQGSVLNSEMSSKQKNSLNNDSSFRSSNSTEIFNEFGNDQNLKKTYRENKTYSNLAKNQNPRLMENSKQQVISITYEEIGLFPRSFNRVFDRFFKQLFFDVENLVIQEYRFYRYLFLTTVKCLFILIFVPLAVNIFCKNYLVRPITEYYWNSKQPEIFLNSHMQKRAFSELKEFEERMYFESLVVPSTAWSGNHSVGTSTILPLTTPSAEEESSPVYLNKNPNKNVTITDVNSEPNIFIYKNALFNLQNPNPVNINISNELASSEDFNLQNLSTTDLQVFQKQFNEYIQKRLQTKTFELAMHYNEESIESITNFFADLISFSTLCYLILNLEIQINITKSFLLEVFFGLDDTKKSLLILLVTDLLVGYHSSNIWELFFASFFDHYGLPENEPTIFLLVATLPVLLDVLFKYLIFRHLNRASPATVATYRAIIE